MAQRNVGRVDRYAQMNKQAELIAKKRAELVEKQRTAQLAKAVAAAQTLAAKLKGAAASAESEGTVAEDATENVNDKTVAEPTAANVVDSAKVQEEKSESKSKKELPPESSKSHNSLTGKTGKISFGIKRSHQAQAPVTDQPPAKVQNSFCNDGSFLENFKKILEKHEQPKPPIVIVAEQAATAATSATTATMEGAGTTVDAQSNTQNSVAALPITTLATSTIPQLTSTPAHMPMATAGSIPIGPPPPQFAFNSAMMQPNLMLPPQPEMVQSNTTLASYTPQPAGMPTAAFFTTAPPQLVPPPPPPTTVAAAMIMPMHAVPNVAPPPPPPPPQIPLALANLAPLYMIPAPEPLQLNAIPAPKEFDLNAIPKPQINLDAIQIPITEQQHQQQQHTHLQQSHLLSQQQQQQQQQVHEQQLTDNNDHNCIQLPTTIENLIDMVADNGDEYEDKLRTHRNQLHPAMWFLFDKNCEQYHKYRQQLNDRRQQHQYQHHQHHHQQQKQQQQQQEQEHSPNHQQQQQLKKQEQIQNDGSLQQLMRTDNDLLQLDKLQENRSTGASAMNAEVDTNDSPIVADADKYDPESVIDSGDVDSDDEYMRNRMDRNRDNIKRRIECRNELSEEERQERAEIEQDQQRRQERKKLRKSRWGDKAEHAQSVSGQSTFGNQHKPLLTVITRSDPALLQYARQNYGTTNLSEEDWKKCEEHYKINLLYQDMLRKRQELDRLARSGKFKYEYDSDEDVEGGTWEHKLRSAEMEATQAWATALTKQSEGKHHIGDFLPPEELKKFMEQYEAKKNNRQPDLSDYKEYKLKEDNIGFQMLQKLGWKEGQGLGSAGAGIVDPVNKGPQRDGNQGLGVASAATPENCDNEYDAYRKRMMLAYRFRPNPLNNPRRAYY